MNDKPPLGIAWDKIGWWVKLEQFAREMELDCEVFEMERSDWLSRVRDYRAVLWRPNLDPPYCQEAREKIYLLEHHLHKRIFPNWATFWHYDNKKAQAYLMDQSGIPTPACFVSYSEKEAYERLAGMTLPVVSKSAGGASSEAVRLLRTPADVRRDIRRALHEPLPIKVLRRLGVTLRLRPDVRRGYVLWQDFVPDNPRDFRVTIIGKKYGFVFWRNNRPGDFRASGSGLIDYDVADGRTEVALCIDLCRRHDFDSMAFDFVYHDGRPVILEMSYAFNDQAIYDAPGHFVAENPEPQEGEAGRHGDVGRVIDPTLASRDHETPTPNALRYVQGHTWPQELVIRYVKNCLNVSHPTDRAPTHPDPALTTSH
ncbi:MAG: RimK family alpha-L-glutamate ligase [Phycisphaerae bacterium]